MHTIEQIFINGEFVTPHGTEWFDLYNPATAQVIGQVRLADEVDAERAVAAAKAAFPAWSQTTKQERLAALKRMHAAVAARHATTWSCAFNHKCDQCGFPAIPMPVCGRTHISMKKRRLILRPVTLCKDYSE